MNNTFLTAEWRKLIVANYSIDPALLTPFLPVGTELDLFDGVCYVSLVGFKFEQTKVKGFSIPFHSDFEEVNLRFYVSRFCPNEQITKRGVVFIKEIVPKAAITFVANTLYKEHYETLPMGSAIQVDSQELNVKYSFEKKGQEHYLSVCANNAPSPLIKGSLSEFILEHYWGYTKINDQSTSEYEVTHPKWEAYPVKQFDIGVDFEKVYGAPFAFLSEQSPVSVYLAEGSEITVEGKKQLRIS